VQLITACERGNKACVGELKRLSQNERCLVEKGSSAVFSAGLVENLVSVGKLCDEGKAIVFDREGVKIYKEGIGEYERWHNKLGHIGAKQIKMCNIPNLKQLVHLDVSIVYWEITQPQH